MQGWNLWCLNLKSSLCNLRPSLVELSVCLYCLPFRFNTRISPLDKPSFERASESFHCVLSFSSEFLKHSEQCRAQIQAKASCWERIETVFGSSATVVNSACLYCILLRCVLEARVLFPKTHSFPFLPPARISRKGYFRNSAAGEHMKGVRSKRWGENECVGREKGNDWGENLQEIGGNRKGEKHLKLVGKQGR